MKRKTIPILVKRRPRRDHWDLLMIGAVCLIMVAYAYAVLDTPPPAPVVKPQPEYVHPPKIPQCDKELWDRVKDGCP